MELNDLRRHWQQPEAAAPAALDKITLTRLLSQQSSSVVAKLRRNARLELGINYVLLLVALAVAGWASRLWVQLFGGLLALVAVVCIYYFYRKLGLLRTMDDPADDLRNHLLRITQGLRALTRFYYRLTLAMIPVTALINGVIALTATRHPLTSLRIVLVLAGLLVLSAALYWPVARATTWYLQRLYGQHLDRLDYQLTELKER